MFSNEECKKAYQTELAKGTILIAEGIGVDAIQTQYLGTVGYVPYSAIQPVDPETEIYEFQDEVFRYYILKALGKLQGIQVHVMDETDDVNGGCGCGDDNGIYGKVRCCTKYTDEYLALTVTVAELQTITSIDMDGSMWKNCNLSGQWRNARSERDPKEYNDVRVCFNLKQLRIDLLQPPALDVTILADCTQLEKLEIHGMDILDPSKLEMLEKLQSLSLQFTKGNYDKARFPKNLKQLDVYGSSAWHNYKKGKQLLVWSDATNLMFLSELTELKLDETQITDLFPLRLLAEGGTKISIWASDPAITDYAPIGTPEAPISFPNQQAEQTVREILGRLEGDLCYSDVKDLESLDLADCQLKDIAFLRYFTGLKSLNLSGNRISDLSPLRGLTELEELNLSGNQIIDLEPVGRLEKLTVLDVAKNRVNIQQDTFSGMLSLHTLDLSSNQLKTLPPLPDTIASLNLSNNQLTDITVLGKLSHLSNLDISQNKIKDVSCLLDKSYALQGAAYMAIGDNLHAAIAYRRAGMPMESLKVYNLDGLVASATDEGTNAVICVSYDGKVNVCGSDTSYNYAFTNLEKNAGQQTQVSFVFFPLLRNLSSINDDSDYLFLNRNGNPLKGSKTDSHMKGIKQIVVYYNSAWGLLQDGNLKFEINEEWYNDKVMTRSLMDKAGAILPNQAGVQLTGNSYYNAQTTYLLQDDGSVLSLPVPYYEMPSFRISSINGAQYICSDFLYIYWIDTQGNIQSISKADAIREAGMEINQIIKDTRYYTLKLQSKYVIECLRATSEWKNVVALYATDEAAVVYALHADGSVSCSESERNAKVAGWRDIVALSATSSSVIGVKADGTVVTTLNCDVSSWKAF